MSRSAGARHVLTDLSLDASWKASLVTLLEALAIAIDHPISQLKNFSIWLNPGDGMHAGSLGILTWFLGAVLYELVHDGPWEGSVADRLDILWTHINAEYRSLGSTNRLSTLPLTLFDHGQKAYPCFTGKASEAMNLLFVLREMCLDVSVGSLHDRHRLAFCSIACAFFFKASNRTHTSFLSERQRQ